MPTTLNEIPKVFLYGETLESAELNEIISLVNLTIRKINNVETNLENHSYDVSIPITNIYCRTKKGINAINFFPQADAKRDELLDLVSNCSTTQGIKYNTTFSTVTLSENADLMNGIWTAYPQGVSESLPHEWEVSYKRLEDNSIMYMFGPVLRSNYGYSGADGDSVQYVYKTFNHLLTDIERTNNTPIRPENPNSNGEFIPSGWFDDPQGPTADYPFEYVATLKRINGTWGSFEKIALWSTYTEDGANGDFLIRAFCRFTPTSNKLAPNTPIGGVYNSPLPGSNDNIQWSLTIPPEDTNNKGPVWTSTKIFRGSGQDTEWSTPTIEADSATLDIEYSSNTEKPAENTLRDAPRKNHPSTGIWHDPTEVNIDLSTMIWRAERKIKNGQYDGNWVITKITGSKGAFKSIVFRRFKPTMQQSSPATPTGGTYSNPIPDGGLWYDGIPAGDSKTYGPIWSSTKIFHDDGTLTNWSAPQLQSDSEDLDIEFSPLENLPSNPTGEPFSNREADGWYDPSSANFNSVGPMIWRAEIKVKNGLYVGNWTVSRILGEKGELGYRGDFVSRVFCRNSQNIGNDLNRPTGGTYDEPWPTNKDLSGNRIWSDGIPASGSGKIWTSTRKFYGDPNHEADEWSIPTIEADSNSLDIEYSTNVIEPSANTLRQTPGTAHPVNTGVNWYDPSLLDLIPTDPTTNKPYPIIWRAERRISGTVYDGDWVITRIFLGEEGPEGRRGSFKSCVFKRSNSVLSNFNTTDDGATYDSPIPTGWSDGIPSGDEALWMAVSKFTGNGNEHSNWTVTQQTDSVDLDIEFSPEVDPTMDLSVGSVFTHPINNYESNGKTPTTDRTDRNDLGWWDSSQLDENSPTMVWRAERKINGLQLYEGNWVITRIKGEKGDGQPDYIQTQEAWSSVESVANVTTEPTPNGGWSDTTPANLNNYAYLWRRSRKMMLQSDGTYAAATGSDGLWKYTRLSGTNGASISVKGTVATVADLNNISNPQDGDAYVVSANGHLYMWSSEANEWIDLGQFKGDPGVTYYTHVAWASAVTLGTTPSGHTTTGQTTTPNATNVTGFSIAPFAGAAWMGILVNTMASDSNDGLAYTWKKVEGPQGEDAVSIVISPASLIVNQDLNYTTNLSNLTEKFVIRVYKGSAEHGQELTVNGLSFVAETVPNSSPTAYKCLFLNGGGQRSGNSSIAGNELTLKEIRTYTQGGKTLYYDSMFVDVTATYNTNKTIKARVRIYANLLGTWSEEVVGDAKTEVAKSLSYAYDPSGQNVVSLENMGKFIKSSTQDTSELRQKVYVDILDLTYPATSSSIDEMTVNVLAGTYKVAGEFNLANLPTGNGYLTFVGPGVNKTWDLTGGLVDSIDDEVTFTSAGVLTISAGDDVSSGNAYDILNLAIYQSQDKIAKLELTADGLTSDVKAIKAGKNLLPLTSGWEGYGGAAVKYDKKNFGVWDENSDLYSPFIRLAEGQSVCFSAYMSSYAAQSGNWYIGYGSTPPVHLSDLYDNARIAIALTKKPGDSITVDGTTYDRYYYVLNAGTVFVDQYITFNFADLYKLFCPQLENGNAPTAFSASSFETSSQIHQTASEISLGVQTDIEGKLYSTGINIQGNNRTIDVQADHFNIHNSNNVRVMGVDSYGNMYIKGALQYDKVERYYTSDVESETGCMFLFDDDMSVAAFKNLPASTIILSGPIGGTSGDMAVLLPPPENMLGANIELVIPTRADVSNTSHIYLAVGRKVLSTSGSGDYVPQVENYNSIFDMVNHEVPGTSRFWIAGETTADNYRTYIVVSVSSPSTQEVLGYDTLRLCAAYDENLTKSFWYVKSFTKY